MSVDPKRVAEIVAQFERTAGLTPKPQPKARAVAVDGEVVSDANVQVSEADPNYRKNDGGVVRVRRSDFVTINMELYEAQQQLKREDRLRRKEIDPARLGHWDDPSKD